MESKIKIEVKVHPGSSREKIVKFLGKYEIWLKEKPVGGKANKSLEKFLKKHLKKKFRIVKGFNSRNKILESID